ncbi:MAG TPA: polysaccharide deacetylase family protein [Burkholderiales bacterium]
MKLALKIDVDTLRGTREGVPRLVELLKKHRAGATFLFSLGPDHTGRALRRVFRKNFLRKVARTSVVEHYGIRTLLHGTLLPGPDIGLRCKSILKSVRDEGFEVGIHCWDHVRWQDFVARKDAAWTEREMQLACERFEEIFGEPARTWGAAGWQTNAHAARFQERFAYASDTRGRHPFQPAWNGALLGCPQIPTTLPTLDELLGLHGDVVQHLLGLTGKKDHVFTAHAELEGGRLLPLFERLLAGWKAQGYSLVRTEDVFRELSPGIPVCEVVYGEVPGRSGRLALQGKEVPA